MTLAQETFLRVAKEALKKLQELGNSPTGLDREKSLFQSDTLISDEIPQGDLSEYE